MEYKQTAFFDLVDCAIRLNKQNRKDETYYLLPIHHYYNEFCSIDINVGRQIGKSAYIKSHANINSLVYVYNKSNFEPSRIYEIGTHRDLIFPNNRFRGRSFRHIDTVYIDEGSFISRVNRIDLFKQIALCTGNKKDITFVFLG